MNDPYQMRQHFEPEISQKAIEMYNNLVNILKKSNEDLLSIKEGWQRIYYAQVYGILKGNSKP